MQCRVCGELGEATTGACAVCGTPDAPPETPRHLPVIVTPPSTFAAGPPPFDEPPHPAPTSPPPLAAGPNWPVVAVGITVVFVLLGLGMIWRSSTATPPPDPDQVLWAQPPMTATTAPPPPALSVPPAGFSPVELRRSLGDAVVPLLLDGCGTTRTATGVAIAPNQLLTSADVARLDASPSLQLPSVFTSGRTVGVARQRGIAVVEVTKGLPDYLGWADPDAITPGLAVIVVGYEALGDPVTVPARIDEVIEVGGVATTATISGDLPDGVSGAPAVTEDGRIAGVVTAVDSASGQATMLLSAPATESFGLIVGDPSPVEPDCEERVDTAVDSYGDDPALDVLYDDCGWGDPFACDELYQASGAGTAYELFARTCGTRRPDGRGYCAQRYLGGAMPPPGEPQDPLGRDQPVVPGG